MFQNRVLTLILISSFLLAACELDARSSRPAFLVRQTVTPNITATLTATPVPTVAVIPTQTPIPSPTPSPTNTPTPTITPIASARLATALHAYNIGNLALARTEFNSLLEDPGADPEEKRVARYWLGRSELDLGASEAAQATLKQFLVEHPTDELARAAQFNLGRAYERSGQTAEAIDAYLGSLVPDDPANVYIYEIIGDLYFNTGAYTSTIAAYQAGIAATEDVSFKVHLSEGIAQAALLYTDTPEIAITQYQDILKTAKIPAYRAKILRLLGDAYRLNNNEPAAIGSYLQAVNNYPEAYDSYLALVELVNANEPVGEFQRGLIDYHAKAYQPAIAAFERYLVPPVITSTENITKSTASSVTEVVPTSYPPPNADEALWLMARSWQALGQYNSAIFTFQRLIDEFPDSVHWGEAHVELGRTLIDQENYSLGKDRLRQFAVQNPNHSLAPVALWRAARLEMDQDLIEEAYLNLRQLVKEHPDSEYADDALFWAGRMAYLQNNYVFAIESWEALEENYPASELNSFAGYWHGRALLELGRTKDAEQVLSQVAVGSPIDYYRLRARDWLNGNKIQEPLDFTVPDNDQLAIEQAETELWLAEWLALETPDNLSSLSDPIKQDPAFRRGDELLRFGLRDKALLEFEQVKDEWWNDPLAMYQLAVYFSQQQLGQLAILAAARVSFLSPVKTIEDAPVYLQRLYYPLYFGDVILAEARSLDLDPALIAAIIRQESLFERSAESSVGARGLAQVMPGTGEYVADRSEFGDFDTDLLWHPYISIKFGAWYISQQLNIFEGNLFAAIVAYNAGPGNVLNWIDNSDDLDIFVESIPFWESRTYIRRVYENVAAYRRLYGHPQPTD